MKSVMVRTSPSASVSHPARGAWIEIAAAAAAAVVDAQSHPARGAWIEIRKQADKKPAVCVAPRKGCVD